MLSYERVEQSELLARSPPSPLSSERRDTPEQQAFRYKAQKNAKQRSGARREASESVADATGPTSQTTWRCKRKSGGEKPREAIQDQYPDKQDGQEMATKNPCCVASTRSVAGQCTAQHVRRSQLGASPLRPRDATR